MPNIDKNQSLPGLGEDVVLISARVGGEQDVETPR